VEIFEYPIVSAGTLVLGITTFPPEIAIIIFSSQGAVTYVYILSALYFLNINFKICVFAVFVILHSKLSYIMCDPCSV